DAVKDLLGGQPQRAADAFSDAVISGYDDGLEEALSISEYSDGVELEQEGTHRRRFTARWQADNSTTGRITTGFPRIATLRLWPMRSTRPESPCSTGTARKTGRSTTR